jgi:hypothetical protein
MRESCELACAVFPAWCSGAHGSRPLVHVTGEQSNLRLARLEQDEQRRERDSQTSLRATPSDRIANPCCHRPPAGIGDFDKRLSRIATIGRAASRVSSRHGCGTLSSQRTASALPRSLSRRSSRRSSRAHFACVALLPGPPAALGWPIGIPPSMDRSLAAPAPLNDAASCSLHQLRRRWSQARLEQLLFHPVDIQTPPPPVPEPRAQQSRTQTRQA